MASQQQSHGPDGGVDIWLYLQHASKPMIVQCKHWWRKVAVDDMRAFFGVLKSHDLERGIFATSATFTADAAAFASAHGISAQDRAGLLNLIAARSPAQQAALLEVAYEGEYWRPTCASCGVKMVVRQPKVRRGPVLGLRQLCQTPLHLQDSTAHVREMTVSDRGTGGSLTACGEVSTQVESRAQRESIASVKEHS